MSSASCIEEFIRFLDKTMGRLSFNLVESSFSKAFDSNPVFVDIERRGGFSKNIIVVLGGRGCGKTLTIRYIKHRFEKDWSFVYVSGKDLVGTQGFNEFKQKISNKADEVKKDPKLKVIIAIDDVAEASEVSLGYLRNEVLEMVREHAGRLLLVIAAQSERVLPGLGTTLQILKSVLGRAPSAEMFFGENPESNIERLFKTSYINRNPVILFRGATLINLDAYWSRLRSLNSVEELADAIVKIAEFYARNLGIPCDSVLNEVRRKKYGLALLALSSLPKVTDPDDRVVVEYVGEVAGAGSAQEPSALNGLGVAELLRGFFTKPDVSHLAEKAEKLYAELLSLHLSDIDVEDVKRALLESCGSAHYMRVLEDLSVSAFGISAMQEREEESKRRKYGPRVDVIEVGGHGQRLKYVVVHCLRKDKKGYIMSGTLNKLRELIGLGVPRKSESRYLIVLLPSRRHLRSLYSATGPAGLARKGQDFFPLFVDGLADTEKSLIYLLKAKTFRNGEKIP
ncbi:MAG: AAA family ATPase, partial [Candidatus Methanomethylicaceae archaeon]